MSTSKITLEQSVRVMQIIAGALVMGAASFAAVAVIVRPLIQNPAQGWIVSILGGAAAGVMLFAQFVVPGSVSTRLVRRDGSELTDLRLSMAYQSGLIVGLALLEGAAFFNLVAYIIEGNWWTLVIAGVLVLSMLAAFPTGTRVRHWMETQRLSHP